MRVAIVEDDPLQRRLIEKTCEAHGLGTATFGLAQPFLRHTAIEPFDLALIDLHLPDMHGIELLTRLRTRSTTQLPAPPSIVITGANDIATMRRAFEAGAADFVAKPIHCEALMVRAKALVQQSQPRLFEDAPIRLGPLELNLATHQVFVYDKEIHLTRKEVAILWLLARQSSQVVTRCEIARLVWGTRLSPTSRTIDAHMARLRKKLDLDHPAQIRLRPAYGVGYRLDVFS